MQYLKIHGKTFQSMLPSALSYCYLMKLLKKLKQIRIIKTICKISFYVDVVLCLKM